jgi:uncharacterized protein involved in exopolysaccharide biosynthesis
MKNDDVLIIKSIRSRITSMAKDLREMSEQIKRDNLGIIDIQNIEKLAFKIKNEAWLILVSLDSYKTDKKGDENGEEN